MEWISVEDELPPQKWSVIVKNGKAIVVNVKYHYKKWYHWNRKLHQVTHWKFSNDCRPSVPPKEMNAYLRRAQKYKHQMQKRNFQLASPLILTSSPPKYSESDMVYNVLD